MSSREQHQVNQRGQAITAVADCDRARHPSERNRSVHAATAVTGEVAGLAAAAFLLSATLSVPTVDAASLAGISNGRSGYELRKVDSWSGRTHLAEPVTFDSRFWYPASFTVTPDGTKAFAVSRTSYSPLFGKLFRGNTLHVLDLGTGSIVWTRKLEKRQIGEIEALRALSPEKLIGLSSGHALVEIDAKTGLLRVLNRVSFDNGSWGAETFSVDPEGNRAFAIMRGNRSIIVGDTAYRNVLYVFALQSGRLLSSYSLDTRTVGEIEALHALSPEKLVGISRGHNLVEIDASSGRIRTIGKISFDSGHWYPASFTVAGDGTRAFAVSKTKYACELGKTFFGNTLHEFSLNDAYVESTLSLGKPTDVEVEALALVPYTRPGTLRAP